MSLRRYRIKRGPADGAEFLYPPWKEPPSRLNVFGRKEDMQRDGTTHIYRLTHDRGGWRYEYIGRVRR